MSGLDYQQIYSTVLTEPAALNAFPFTYISYTANHLHCTVQISKLQPLNE